MTKSNLLSSDTHRSSPPRRLLYRCLLAALLLATTLSSEAFVTHRLSSSSTNTRQPPSSPFHRYPTPHTRIVSSLQIAKSGGKVIDSEEMYVENVLAKDLPRPVLVFFSAPWCGPCRLTNPVVKEVMKQYTGDLDVVEVCTDDLAEVSEQAGVVSIPTIHFYYGGELLDTIIGCVAKSVLANAVDKVLEDIQLVKQ